LTKCESICVYIVDGKRYVASREYVIFLPGRSRAVDGPRLGWEQCAIISLSDRYRSIPYRYHSHFRQPRFARSISSNVISLSGLAIIAYINIATAVIIANPASLIISLTIFIYYYFIELNIGMGLRPPRFCFNWFWNSYPLPQLYFHHRNLEALPYTVSSAAPFEVSIP